MSPARGERRRASHGNTHDPFDCCGSEAGPYGRPKGKICRECADLIKEGRAARARIDPGLDVFKWASTNYGWPKFYRTGATFSHAGGCHDTLADAFWRLVNTVSVPAPGDTPRDSPKTATSPHMGRYHLPWPTVLDETRADSWSWETLILLRPDVRTALDGLYRAISAALGDVFEEGRRRGGNALMGLASGDLSLADFDDTLAPAGEKRQRNR